MTRYMYYIDMVMTGEKKVEDESLEGFRSVRLNKAVETCHHSTHRETPGVGRVCLVWAGAGGEYSVYTLL